MYFDSDSNNPEAIKKRPYYYMKKDFQKEITKETLKNFLVEDGYNPDYFKLLSKIKIKSEANESIEINENENKVFILKENSPNKIYIDLIIDDDKEKERIKNEEENEKQNEKSEFELQFSNVNQISNELNDIKKQINYLSKDIKNEQNEMLKCIKNNLYSNKKLFSQSFDNNNNNIPNHGQESKYLLKLGKNEKNYELFGRKEELDDCINNLKDEHQKKLCIFGTKGVGKKSFVKKVGFSAIDANIFDKVYYLEINPIEFINLEMKVNIIIDEIYEYNTKGKILLIIYFNEKINRIYDLKDFINVCESNKNNDITISYLFTFTVDDFNINECQEEFTNYIELTHFKKYENKEKIIANFKELFNFCIENKKNNISNDLIEEINSQFNGLLDIENENKSLSSLNLKNKISQSLGLNNKDSLSEENNIIEIKEDNNIIQSNEIIEENNIQKKEVELKGAKINNIFLLAIYLDFFNDIKDNEVDIEQIFSKLIKDDDIQIKKQIISSIMKQEGKDDIYNIFLYLNKLICGIGKTSLKILLNDGEDESKINFIKNKLNGLINVEYYMEEEIFKLDSSFKDLIEEIINNDKNLIISNEIMKNYCECLRKSLKGYEKNKGFHACIDNNFWYNDEIKQLLEKKNKNSNMKFVCDIDSNNIYYLIKNIKDIYNNKETQKYIDDISISLPTLLYFTNNFYYEHLIIDAFEKLYENINEKENSIRISELILRLGIFKYWISKNSKFLEKSLKLVGISDNININLNDEAKFEFYLSKIYDCIIKKEKYFEQYIYECNKILEKSSSDVKEKNQKRLNDLKSITITKIDKDPRHKFFFLLSDPLKNKEFKTILNSNFYLTQKLLTKIPSNYDIEFKTFDGENDLKELHNFFGYNKDDWINVNFVYLSNKALKDELFKYKVHIKILILGYLGSEEILNNEVNLNYIRNIIYISDNKKIKFNDKVNNYNNKNYYYYFELYFNQFIHDFISLITSKYEYCTIKKAFNKSKRNFVTKFKRLFESEYQFEKDQLNQNKKYEELIKSIDDLIQIKSGDNNEDVFEIDNQDEEENLNNQQKVIKDIYDEYEFEYNKINNIYYRKNPFTEESESPIKKEKYKKYMKLPGIDYLSPKNFKYFIEKEIYDVNERVAIIEEKIKSEKKLINIHGKDKNFNVFDLGDELCKYFYMKGKFQNGIYIVSPRNIEEEKNSLIEHIKLKCSNDKNKFTDILILIKLLSISYQNIENEIINFTSSLKNEIGAHILVCSEKRLMSEQFDFINLNEPKK